MPEEYDAIIFRNFRNYAEKMPPCTLMGKIKRSIHRKTEMYHRHLPFTLFQRNSLNGYEIPPSFLDNKNRCEMYSDEEIVIFNSHKTFELLGENQRVH